MVFALRIVFCTDKMKKMSLRATSVSRNTIMRVNQRVGDACHRLHHARMQNLQPARLGLDETWSFIQKRPSTSGSLRPG